MQAIQERSKSEHHLRYTHRGVNHRLFRQFLTIFVRISGDNPTRNMAAHATGIRCGVHNDLLDVEGRTTVGQLSKLSIRTNFALFGLPTSLVRRNVPEAEFDHSSLIVGLQTFSIGKPISFDGGRNASKNEFSTPPAVYGPHQQAIEFAGDQPLYLIPPEAHPSEPSLSPLLDLIARADHRPVQVVFQLPFSINRHPLPACGFDGTHNLMQNSQEVRVPASQYGLLAQLEPPWLSRKRHLILGAADKGRCRIPTLSRTRYLAQLILDQRRIRFLTIHLAQGRSRQMCPKPK